MTFIANNSEPPGTQLVKQRLYGVQNLNHASYLKSLIMCTIFYIKEDKFLIYNCLPFAVKMQLLARNVESKTRIRV